MDWRITITRKKTAVIERLVPDETWQPVVTLRGEALKAAQPLIEAATGRWAGTRRDNDTRKQGRAAAVYMLTDRDALPIALFGIVARGIRSQAALRAGARAILEADNVEIAWWFWRIYDGFIYTSERAKRALQVLIGMRK